MSPYPARAATPSCILAPPESLIAIIGAPILRAIFCILTILSAAVLPSEPPNTVKSYAYTNTSRPAILPYPATMPSPAIFFLSMPKFVHWCTTNLSTSAKVPLSSRTSILSLAVILPPSCCLLMRSSPPPRFAALFNSTNFFCASLSAIS